MKPLPTSFTRFMHTLSAVAPWVAAEIAYRLFWFIGRPPAVRAEDEAMHAAARLSYLSINGKRVAVYTWGEGDRVVLLVHGWRSRASRFSTLARALESPGRTVISFDAPGHGASGGKRTTVLEYAAIIRLLHERHGRFELVVGYSLGVLGAFLARRDGVKADAMVAIAGPYTMEYVFTLFAQALRLSPRATALLRGAILRRVLANDEEGWNGFVSRAPEPGTPLLVIHDENDAAVDVAQARLIAEADPGEAQLVVTTGLGHSRIITDAAVIDRITDFIGKAAAKPTRG